MSSKPPLIAFICLIIALAGAGCATHQPLPQLRYKAAPPEKLPPAAIETFVKLETGEAIGHSLTSFALLPGGYAMPITSPSTSATAFNAEDQAAVVQNLARVLTERRLIRLSDGAQPAAELTVTFLKTEHFPEMQDYVLDVLVATNIGGTPHDKVYHVSTIEGVNLGARMFQRAHDGRRNAAELFLAAAVPDLENWLINGASTPPPGSVLIAREPFNIVAPKIAAFLHDRYARPSTFWKDGISVRLEQPSERVAAIELRWSDAATLPPFCFVDLYAEGEQTRIVIREKNRLLSAKAHVLEAVEAYLKLTP
jgi:hypothetical protein